MLRPQKSWWSITNALKNLPGFLYEGPKNFPEVYEGAKYFTGVIKPPIINTPI